MELKVNHINPSEAYVQAELYRGAGIKNLFCMPELSVRSLRLRIDMAFHDRSGIVYAVVEVTRGTTWRDRTQSKQYDKYMKLELPFRFCEGINEVAETIEWVRMREQEFSHRGG